jgi:hypothetical protein
MRTVPGKGQHGNYRMPNRCRPWRPTQALRLFRGF